MMCARLSDAGYGWFQVEVEEKVDLSLPWNADVKKGGTCTQFFFYTLQVTTDTVNFHMSVEHRARHRSRR